MGKKEKDLCIICWKETQYYKDTPLAERKNYLETHGQPCDTCAENLRKEGVVV